MGLCRDINRPEARMSKSPTPHQQKQQLLAALLDLVPHHGWTPSALAKAAKAARLTEAETARLFPRGLPDAIALFQSNINEHLLAAIAANRAYATLRTREKVAFGVRARLDYLTPYRKAVDSLLSWSLTPASLRDSSKYLWQAADEIWKAAGDTSTDYNRYTKRLMLMGVMKATLSKWLKDTSSDHTETWAFLARRIDNIVTAGMSVGKTIDAVKNIGRKRTKA